MNYLIIAGLLNAIAALAHIGIIIGGASGYRFFGAGENMAKMAEQGSIKPAFITLCIAAMLFIWSFYAFSGAGLSIKLELPIIKYALLCITFMYLLRGTLGLILVLFPNTKIAQANSRQFWIYSSLVCLLFGVIHAKGIYGVWYRL